MCARRGEKFLRFVEKRPVLTLTILLTASAPGLWPTRERENTSVEKKYRIVLFNALSVD